MGEIERFLKAKCFPALLLIVVCIFCSVTPSPPALAENTGQSASQKIVVGGDYNYPPYEFIDEAGEPAGYNVDLTRAVAEVMGFDVEVKLRPWSETRRALEDGDIDAIQGMFYSKDREDRVDFSTSHTVVHHAIFARKGTPPIESVEELRGKDIIVMRADILHDYVREKGFSSGVTLVETQADALRLLASGRHDYALIARLPASYWMTELELSNIVAVGSPILPSQYCYAVREGNAEVLALFSEGLAILHQSGQHKEIYDKWLGALEPRGIPRGLIIKSAAVILTPLLLLLIGFWFWSWNLKKQVSLRTEDLSREIAERKRAEQALQEAHGNLEQRVKERTGELVRANVELEKQIEIRKRTEQEMRRVNRAQRVLGACSQAMVNSIGEVSFLNEICRIIVEVGGYRLAWVGLAEQDEERRVRPVAQAGYEDGYLDTVDITWADIPHGRGPTGTAIRTGSPSVARNILTNPNYKPWQAEALKRGYNSSIALPLFEGEGCCGAINIYATETDSFDEHEVNLLGDLAADVSYGLKVFRLSAAEKSAERQFWKTKALLLSVIDGISEPLVVLDKNLSVNMLNGAALHYYQLASYQQAINEPCYKVFKGEHAPCPECHIPSVMAEGEKFTLSRKGLFDPSRFEQVTVYPLKDRAGGAVGCILRISDITEQKDVERHLARADRLSSLGQLSGGIAHEIRNPLSGISLFVDILADEEEFQRTDKELEVLQEIKDNINRIDGIIRGVLSFARESDSEATEIDLNSLIQENLKLWYARMRNAKIELELSLDEDLPAIFGDVIGIQQVVNNLVQNGVEALDGDGFLQISTQNGMSKFFANRPVVIISIQDNGLGIAQDLEERIFDPFFTTKSAGTGLGLSISHQIIKRHGGVISCTSNPGQGTLFRVELPVEPKGLERKSSR